MKRNPLWKNLEVVLKNPQFVFLNEDRLREIALDWASDDFMVPAWREEVFPESSTEFLEFIGLANSINFCFLNPYNPKSGEYFFNWRGKKWSGSFGMAAALRAAMEKGVPLLDWQFLQKLSKKQGKEIFCQDTEIPLLEKRVNVLREIGAKLGNDSFGSFREIFRRGQWRAFDTESGIGIITLLVNTLPSFSDANYHRDFNVNIAFHKRAQLLLMVYQGRALSESRNYPFINDYQLLGPPADYELPKVLRSLGILEYAYILAGKVKNQKIILSGNRKELEIRVQTIKAMLKLQDNINVLRGDKKINMLELDYKIWSAGRNLRNINHHLTPTIAY